MTSPSRRIVVCGTDTDVGKTVVSAWLVQGLEASYWKPVSYTHLTLPTILRV